MAIVLRRRVTSRYRAVYGVIALGLGVLFIVYLATSLDNRLFDQAGPSCALLGLLAAWHAAFHPDLLWTLDSESVTSTRKTVFGTRHRQWPMSDVAAIRVRTIDGDEWPDTYYVELRLASGKRLKLPPYRRQGRADEIAQEIETLRRDAA